MSVPRVTELAKHVSRAVEAAARDSANYATEERFQEAFVEALGDCQRELRMVFDPPASEPRVPPLVDVAECLAKGRKLPPSGRDPCQGSRRKLDVLWHSPAGDVPIELKARDRRNSDVYGYEFLKDVHRLERLRQAGEFRELTTLRFAVFVTTVPDYWSTLSAEPSSFRLSDGHSIPAGYWVQYDQPSAATRWYDYPPFFLANAYDFEWTALEGGGRYLQLSVARQER